MNVKRALHSKYRFLALIWFCLTVGEWAVLAQSHRPSEEQRDRGDAFALSRVEVDHAIALATDYLERACGTDGKFLYEVQIGSGRESSSYDIIRHEGAMYALSMTNRYHSDPKIVDTMVRAAGFLRQNYVGVGVRPDQLAVWSKPLGETPDRQYAELGGTALGLVALAATREVDPRSVPLADLQALARFVLFLQREDGGFIHKYRMQGGAEPKFTSLYYPGEAALGLIALYEIDHSSQWLVAAAKALSYLAKSRVGLTTVPADHWALIATAKLFPYVDQVKSVVSRDELIEHATQVCNSILREQFKGGAAAGLDGAFDAEGRTAPAATRLEALLAALEFLPNGEIRGRIEKPVEHGVSFLVRLQVVSGQQAGGMPGALATRAHDSSEIRIDYVQHALCAWIRYQSLFVAS